MKNRRSKRAGTEFVRRAEFVRPQAPELSTRNRLPRFRQDTRKPDGEKSPSPEEEVEREMSGRKKTPRQTAGNRKICQDSKMTSASQIKTEWQHQTKMSRARHVKDKGFR